MYDIKQIQREIKEKISEFRYEHSIRVAEEAKELAKHYKINEEKAYLAGIIHDIAKEFSNEENEKWIEKYNMPKELLEPEYRNIIHSDIGAVVAKEKYHLDDEICNGIKYHTIGDVSMTLFDKIIFIADKIGRKNNNLEIEQIKELAYQNIDEALKFYLIKRRERLESKGESFHPKALELLNSL